MMKKICETCNNYHNNGGLEQIDLFKMWWNRKVKEWIWYDRKMYVLSRSWYDFGQGISWTRYRRRRILKKEEKDDFITELVNLIKADNKVHDQLNSLMVLEQERLIDGEYIFKEYGSIGISQPQIINDNINNIANAGL